MVEIGKDITLANGKGYSPKNIDLKVLMNMNNIPRGYLYAGVPPHDNYTLQDHSMGCFYIAHLYFDYLEDNGKNEILEVFPKSLIEKWGKGGKQLAKSYFAQTCLLHDVNEVVTGDLVPSFKTEEYREKEDKVFKEIMNYLNIQIRKDPEKKLKKHVKIVDFSQSMKEIDILADKYPSVERIFDQRKEKLETYISFEEIKPFLKIIGIKNFRI